VGEPICEVEGYQDPDQAIGAVIRTAATTCSTRGDVVNFIAGLFGDTSHRSADVTLARAVRFANTKRHRQHAGVTVTIAQAVPADRQAATMQPLKLKKGGAS
jgi:hypothetical protein